MAIVGEVEVLVRANTTMLGADIAGAGEVDSSLAGLAAKTEAGGKVAGQGLKDGLEIGGAGLATGLTADVEKETGKMEGLFNELGQKASNSLNSVGVPKAFLNGPAVAGVAAAAVGVFAVKMASDMQDATASIVSSEGITVKAAQNIGAAFDSTAFKSEYSGIAQAQAFAAVAGQLKATEGQALTTKQSLDFMAASTDLATAKGIDLGTATSTLAGVMQAFHTPLSQVTVDSNLLFNASNATGQSVDALATSVEKLKAKLGGAAPPLQDLTALSVDLTKQGITGRAAVSGMNTAVTSLAGAAEGLTKTGKTSEATLQLYGLSAKTATGQLTPLSEIIAGLAPKFRTMTQSQQLATATAIFGAGAAKQMTAVILAGSTAFDQATAAVTKHNAVQEAASIKSQTLAGDFDRLKAGVTSEATQLGGVLVPALTAVVGAIFPVISGVTELVGWFEKGSGPAIAIATVIGAVVAPALINMGVQATISAAKSVIAFVQTGVAATVNAAKTVAALAGQDVAVQTSATTVVTSAGEVEAALGEEQLAFEGLGTTVTEVAGVVETETVAMGASFTAMAGVAAAGLASFILTLKGLDALRNHFTVKPSAKLGAAGQNLANLEQQAGITDQATAVLGQRTVDYLLDQQKKKKEEATKAAAAKFKAEFPTIAIPKIDAYVPPPTTGSTSSSTKLTPAEKAAKAKATALAKAEAEAMKAENTLAGEIDKAVTMPYAKGADYLHQLGVPVSKASQVLHDAVEPFNQAVNALEHAGFDASNAVRIAQAGTNATTKAQAAATKAENLLASEVTNAVGKPLTEAKDALHALGVPVSEASTLLKDAVLPFNQAVTALEKAGFDAANAVKIAEAGTAQQLKNLKSSSSTATGLLVNGIEVSGEVYDAAIGQAFKEQTHEKIRRLKIPKHAVTPESYGAVGAPPRANTSGTSKGLTIQSGAIVINPAPGNDHRSTLATVATVEAAFKRLETILSGGVSQMGNVFA